MASHSSLDEPTSPKETVKPITNRRNKARKDPGFYAEISSDEDMSNIASTSTPKDFLSISSTSVKRIGIRRKKFTATKARKILPLIENDERDPFESSSDEEDVSNIASTSTAKSIFPTPSTSTGKDFAKTRRRYKSAPGTRAFFKYRQRKNGTWVFHKDRIRSAMNAYKHSPDYFYLKNKMFNTGFLKIRPNIMDNPLTFTAEEIGIHDFPLPEIEPSSIVVPGEKYKNLFKNSPLFPKNEFSDNMRKKNYGRKNLSYYGRRSMTKKGWYGVPDDIMKPNYHGFTESDWEDIRKCREDENYIIPRPAEAFKRQIKKLTPKQKERIEFLRLEKGYEIAVNMQPHMQSDMQSKVVLKSTPKQASQDLILGKGFEATSNMQPKVVLKRLAQDEILSHFSGKENGSAAVLNEKFVDQKKKHIKVGRNMLKKCSKSSKLAGPTESTMIPKLVSKVTGKKNESAAVLKDIFGDGMKKQNQSNSQKSDERKAKVEGKCYRSVELLPDEQLINNCYVRIYLVKLDMEE